MLQFQVWICIIFHGQNLYEFQRSKQFSKLNLLYLYPLSKQSFPNYSQNTRHSSLWISWSILDSPTASKQVLLHSFHLRLLVEPDVKYLTRYLVTVLIHMHEPQTELHTLSVLQLSWQQYYPSFQSWRLVSSVYKVE